MKMKYYLTSADRNEMENLKEKLFGLGNDYLINRYMINIQSLIKIKADVDLKKRPVSVDLSSKLIYLFYHKQLPKNIIKGSELICIDGIMPGIIDLLGDLRKENYRSILFIKEEHLSRNLLFPGNVYEQKDDNSKVNKRESRVAEELLYDYARNDYSQDIQAETRATNCENMIDDDFFVVPF